jgi:hypothetical protein
MVRLVLNCLQKWPFSYNSSKHKVMRKENKSAANCFVFNIFYFLFTVIKYIIAVFFTLFSRKEPEMSNKHTFPFHSGFIKI